MPPTSRTPVLDDETVDRLRAALATARYTVEGVRACLGPRADAALARNETTPGLLATTGGSPLETLVRLWLLQVPVPVDDAEAALPGLVEALVVGGLLVREDGGARAGVKISALADVRPYADDDLDWWVAADLTPGMDGRTAPVPADHVLGVNAAGTTLAQLTVRRPVGRALDVGTGCGIEALHLVRHAGHVVATDVAARALAFARLTARLNRIDVELRQGSMFAPVRGESFDLVVSNPPFVVGPGTPVGAAETRSGHAYRDSGIPGDEVSRRVVVDGAAHLADGGFLQVLANWVHRQGEDWRDHIRAWVDGTGCDAWVVQRERQDPAAYVELWLRDSGEVATDDYRAAYERWLGWFDAQGIDGVGFGWLTLRRTRAEPDVRIEAWPHAIELPLGDTVLAHFRAVDALRALGPDGLRHARLRVADGVVQEQVGPPGADDLEAIVLRQRHGMLRARRVSTEEAGFVGACDGTLPVEAVVRALAEVLEDDVAELRDDLLPVVRELVVDGYLVLGEVVDIGSG